MIKYPIIDFPLYGEKNQEIIKLLPLIKDSFIVVEKDGSPVNKHIYAYAAVNYNMSTPFGWGEKGTTHKERKKESDLKKYITNKDCIGIKEMSNQLNFKSIIIHKEWYYTFKNCKYTEIEKSGGYYLMKWI